MAAQGRHPAIGVTKPDMRGVGISTFRHSAQGKVQDRGDDNRGGNPNK